MTDEVIDDDDTAAVLEILQRRGLDKPKRAAEIVRYFAGPIYDAYPRNTHAGIEAVEAYGLRIDVDANGYASAVHFPDGAEV
jgi:hypothetical protein